MAQHYTPKASEVSDARFQKFLKDFTAYETIWMKTVAQDRFLDAYSVWIRHRSPVTYENLLHAIVKLRKLDASFQFPLPAAADLQGVFDA